MTQKRFNEKEINNVIKEVFDDYVHLFEADKMEYSEFALVENILIKLELKFRELKGDVE